MVSKASLRHAARAEWLRSSANGAVGAVKQLPANKREVAGSDMIGKIVGAPRTRASSIALHRACCGERPHGGHGLRHHDSALHVC